MINLSPQLSQFILTLYQGALKKSLAEFKSWAFEHMQTIIHFDSGLWLSRSDMINPIPIYLAEDTYLFNQAADFIENYHRIRYKHCRPRQAMGRNLHLCHLLW